MTVITGRPIPCADERIVLSRWLQGSEAAIMKLASVLMRNWTEDEGLDAAQIIHMHDEVQYSVLDRDAERVAQLAEHSIASAAQILGVTIPFAGEAKIGNNWGETH